MTLEHYQLLTQPYGLITVIVEHAGGIWRVKYGDECIAEALTKDEALKIAASPRFKVEQQKYGSTEHSMFVAVTTNGTPIAMAPTLKDCIKDAEYLGYRLL